MQLPGMQIDKFVAQSRGSYETSCDFAQHDALALKYFRQRQCESAIGRQIQKYLEKKRMEPHELLREWLLFSANVRAECAAGNDYLADLRDCTTATLKRACAWQADADGVWHTACDNLFEFIDSGPADNKMRFCCYCGMTLSELPYRDALETAGHDMSYPRQGTPEQISAAIKRLRYLTLCERLENDKTKWSHPLYLDLRREAATAIRELLGPPDTDGTDNA